MLGLLLLSFLGLCILSDINTGEWWGTAIDVALIIPTTVFFYGYARSS
jgi:hypothetical protein